MSHIVKKSCCVPVPPARFTYITQSSLKCKILSKHLPLSQRLGSQNYSLRIRIKGKISQKYSLGWALTVPATLSHLGPHLRLLGRLVLFVELWLPQLPYQQILQLLLLYKSKFLTVFRIRIRNSDLRIRGSGSVDPGSERNIRHLPLHITYHFLIIVL